MTDVTAGRLHKVIVHPLTVRITHWVNALAMVIMIMSGWRIYNSEPILPTRDSRLFANVCCVPAQFFQELQQRQPLLF